jgi:hypothetical protein
MQAKIQVYLATHYTIDEMRKPGIEPTPDILHELDMRAVDMAFAKALGWNTIGCA